MILCEKCVDKADWQEMPHISLKDVVTGKLPELKTIVKTAWNDEYIFFQFICEDKNVVSNFTDFNDPLYSEDVVEIFIMDEPSDNKYFEFNVSPNNIHLHYLIIDGKKYARLSDVVKGDVRRTDEGYVTEIKIPSSEFSNPPSLNTIWKVNFFRIDRGETDEYTAASPTGEINFHKTSKFLDFIFVG